MGLPDAHNLRGDATLSRQRVGREQPAPVSSSQRLCFLCQQVERRKGKGRGCTCILKCQHQTQRQALLPQRWTRLSGAFACAGSRRRCRQFGARVFRAFAEADPASQVGSPSQPSDEAALVAGVERSCGVRPPSAPCEKQPRGPYVIFFLRFSRVVITSEQRATLYSAHPASPVQAGSRLADGPRVQP